MWKFFMEGFVLQASLILALGAQNQKLNVWPSTENKRAFRHKTTFFIWRSFVLEP